MNNPIYNPYADSSGHWLRANFHAHCAENSACASIPIGEGVGKYAGTGFDVLAVTDHDAVTDLADVRRVHPGLILIEGFEYSSGPNLLFVGESVPPLFELPLDAAMANAGSLLTIVCHPEPKPGVPYWTTRQIATLPRPPDGIEVYNGHYGIERMRANGCSPLYTRFWDELLSNGHRLWGFVTDDFHDPPDFNNAFSMVLSKERTASAVLDAARKGRLYGSTGLLLESAKTDGQRITIESATRCTGRFIGPGGAVLHEGKGKRFSFKLTEEDYVRFEANGEDGLLFLQPMYRRCMPKRCVKRGKTDGPHRRRGLTNVRIAP